MNNILQQIVKDINEEKVKSVQPQALTKRGGEYRIGLSKAIDIVEEYAAQFAAPPPSSEGEMTDAETVIFFELKNKKYVTKSGFEITTDMLMKAEHFISDDVCYIKVPLATLPTREPEAKEIDDFISELMQSDPIRFVKYCLIIIGRDILDSGAVSLKLSVESDLREGRRFAVNVTGKIKELK